LRADAVVVWVLLVSGVVGCGRTAPSGSGEPDAVLGKLAAGGAPTHQAVVAVTVLRQGEPVSGSEVSLARSISGRGVRYDWTGTTDATGTAVIEVRSDPSGQLRQRGASGYYVAVARDLGGGEVGRWGSLPVRDGRRNDFVLEPGRRAQVLTGGLEFRERFGLQTLGPIPYPDDNPPVTERIELGRLIFFDPILGGEKDVACGTCHHPDFAFADGRKLGAGTSGEGLGPDRMISVSSLTGMPIIDEPRHSQTIFNTAFNGNREGIPSHEGLQFWDGRVKGLEEQSTKPIGDRDEMAGDAYPTAVAMDSVLVRLRSIPEYVALFQSAYPGETTAFEGAAIVNESTYARAIGAYERELVTRNTAYDRYVEGDDGAMTPLQKWGLQLFFTKAKCAICHSGPMFSDFQFVVQGVPQEGPGKDELPGDDLGRFEFSKDPSGRYAFRTPTLRNIELTAPFMHDGVFETLKDVVRFYDDGALPRHPMVSDEMMHLALTQPLGLTDAESDAIVAFMEALTDNGSLLDPMLLTVPDAVPSGLLPVFGLRGVGKPASERYRPK